MGLGALGGRTEGTTPCGGQRAICAPCTQRAACSAERAFVSARDRLEGDWDGVEQVVWETGLNLAVALSTEGRREGRAGGETRVALRGTVWVCLGVTCGEHGLCVVNTARARECV